MVTKDDGPVENGTERRQRVVVRRYRSAVLGAIRGWLGPVGADGRYGGVRVPSVASPDALIRRLVRSSGGAMPGPVRSSRVERRWSR